MRGRLEQVNTIPGLYLIVYPHEQALRELPCSAVPKAGGVRQPHLLLPAVPYRPPP